MFRKPRTRPDREEEVLDTLIPWRAAVQMGPGASPEALRNALGTTVCEWLKGGIAVNDGYVAVLKFELPSNNFEDWTNCIRFLLRMLSRRHGLLFHYFEEVHEEG